MKHYLLVLVSFFTLSFTAVTNAQDEVVTQATYDGFSNELYTFTTIASENETSKTLEFKDVSAEILEQFDLKSEALKGKTFSITYTVKTETQINGDGEEEEVEVYTLKTIKEVAY